MEQIFPFLQPETLPSTAVLPVLREIKWDFRRDMPLYENGAPVMVERIDAVRVWVWNALHTPRWRYEMFSGGYGSDIESMIGKSWSEDLKRAEARQYISECLLSCPYISAVSDLALTFEGDTLTAAFTLQTVYGATKMEDIDVRK